MFHLTSNTALQKSDLKKCALPLMSNNKKGSKLTRKINEIK